jgi:hypothetical protein
VSSEALDCRRTVLLLCLDRVERECGGFGVVKRSGQCFGKGDPGWIA